MSTNPLVSALVAAGYISALVSALHFVNDNELGFIAPILFLSLLVMSVALMGYIFFYHPVRLLIDHKPREASTLLLSTVAYFASITLCVVIVGYALTRL